MAARWPELVDELDGIAAGAGQDTLELLAINARSELLSPIAVTECSSIGRLRGAGVSLAQNWDWHPDLAPARVLLTTAPPGDPWFVTMTEAGILAKVGLNARGLATALNFLTCSVDGGLDGVPVHVLLRVLLERCGSATDALELLMGARVSASACVTIAVAEPGGAALFAVELSPGGAALVRPDADGLLIHTNHFLVPPAQGDDTQPRDHPPYTVAAGASALVELPVHWSLDDAPHFASTTDPRGLERVWLAELEIAASEDRPITFTLHPDILGRPHRIEVLRRILDLARTLGATFEPLGRVASRHLGEQQPGLDAQCAGEPHDRGQAGIADAPLES